MSARDESAALARVLGQLEEACLSRPGLVLPPGEARRALAAPLDEALALAEQVAYGPLWRWCAAAARKLGRLGEALSFADRARALDPGWETELAIGLVHRARGDLAAAWTAYGEVKAARPSDVELRLELSELLLEHDRPDDALRELLAVLRRSPGHAWAAASADYCRVLLGRDAVAGARLEAAARGEGGPPIGDEAAPRSFRGEHGVTAASHGRARAEALLLELQARRAPAWIGFLPAPAEATIRVLERLVVELAREPGHSSTGEPRPPLQLTVRLSRLEAPSSRLAAGLELARLGRAASLDFVVEAPGDPDPREPRGRVLRTLWRWEGTAPAPAVAPPPPEVLDEIWYIARHRYWLPRWAHLAQEAAARLGEGAAEGLLGVMAFPPDPPSGVPAWVWLQRVQVAAALVIAQLGDGWDGSLRQTLLATLALGPEDWSVTAAIVALFQVAQSVPAAAPDVLALFRHLEKQPRTARECHEHALLSCLSRLPGVTAAERAQLAADIGALDSGERPGGAGRSGAA